MKSLDQKMTLAQAFDNWAEEYSRRVALVFRDERIDYQTLHDRVNRMAKGLVRLGIEKGDKLGLLMPNCIEWAISFFAGAKIGAIVVPISTRYKTFELGTILKHADIKVLIAKDEFLKINFMEMIHELVPEVKRTRKEEGINSEKFPQLRSIICLSNQNFEGIYNFNEVMNELSREIGQKTILEKQAQILPQETLSIIYTSGTTGSPKGAMLRNFAVVKKAFDRGHYYGFGPEDKLLLSIPLYTQWGCNAWLFCILTYGGCIILQDHFEPGEGLRLISLERCTIASGVPAIFQMFMENEKFHQYDLSSLRKANVGGDFVQREFLLKVLKEFGNPEVINGYGLTEATGLLTGSKYDDPLETRLETDGKIFPDIEVKIIDPETGQDMLIGKEGEIVTKGYHLMQGYYKNPEETGKMIDQQGWLHTGDLGFFNEQGYLKFKGRIKDMIRSGGFNIFAQEIEELICQHPKVKAAAVVSVPDIKMGEISVAFIILKENQFCESEEILEHCRNKIANYKVPKKAFFLKEVPVSATGRVQKYQLKEVALNRMTSKGS